MSNRSYNKLITFGLPSELAETLISKGLNLTALRKKNASELISLLGSEIYVEAILDKGREPIPLETISQLFFKSAGGCCICQEKKESFIIHHIIKYSETRDNREDNLVLLCLEDHDRVHTRKELSRNFTPEIIKELKIKWENAINEKRVKSFISEKTGENGVRADWGYINVRYLEQFAAKDSIDLKSLDYYFPLLQKNIINKNGEVNIDKIVDELKGRELASIYQYSPFPINNLLRYHKSLLNFLSQKSDIQFIDSNLSEESHLKEGSLYMIRGRYLFKTGTNKKEPSITSVRIKFGDKVIEFQIDHFYFTTNSAHGNLRGQSNCVALLLIRNNGEGKIIRASAIAMGMTYIDLF